MQETIEKTKATVDYFAEVNRILEKHQFSAAKLIPILQEVQAAYKYLSKDMISYVATSIGVPPSRVYGVATFYAHFSLEPKGKHIIRLCDGTACHVRRSEEITQALRKELGLQEGRNTTEDMMFTLETVACLGACSLSPAVVADGMVHGSMTPATARALIEDIRMSEEACRHEYE